MDKGLLRAKSRSGRQNCGLLASGLSPDSSPKSGLLYSSETAVTTSKPTLWPSPACAAAVVVAQFYAQLMRVMDAHSL